MDSLIHAYFCFGLPYRHILYCLSQMHGVTISLSTLKRKLKCAGLFRRKRKTPVLDVAIFLLERIQSNGNNHGYKIMHQLCIEQELIVTQETVRILLGIIDSQGVAIRQRHRLKRRTYASAGPNFMWHIDSYDKLKRYGICINGAIDGFSRHMMWLEAYSTSSDPKVIASYFMQTVRSRGGCPLRMRADRGTENGHVEQMLMFLRSDHDDTFASKCFIYGSSNHNQRIERWWGFLRKHNIQFWMDTFQHLKEEDIFDGGILDKSLIQFCFMNCIQRELDEVVRVWNNHKIRKNKKMTASPCGRPIIMYNCPQMYGCEDYLCEIDNTKAEICIQQVTPKSAETCDRTVFELCCLFMDENRLKVPENVQEGIRLYGILREQILQGIAEVI